MLKSARFWFGVSAGIVTSVVLALVLLALDAQQLTVSVRNITLEPIRAEVWLTDHLQSSFEVAPLKTESVSFRTSDASLSVKVSTPDKKLEHIFGYVTHSPPQDLYVVQVTESAGIEGMRVRKLMGALWLGTP